nr:hypothetical protein [Actinocyclus sp. mgcode 4]
MKIFELNKVKFVNLMKVKKNQRNVLKLYLLNKKTYKTVQSKNVSQLIKLNILELQLKKTFKFFFKLMLKKNFIKKMSFFFLFTVSKKKYLIDLNLLNFFINNNNISINLLNNILKCDFLQLNFFFNLQYLNKKKFSNINFELTNFIFTHDIKSLKKLKKFYSINYLIFWNPVNLTNIFIKLFYFFLIKLLKLN